jgi:hypothetical protein
MAAAADKAGQSARHHTLFQQLLGQTPAQQFFASIQGRSELYTHAESIGLTEVMTWTKLSRILETHRLEPPRLRVVHKGAECPYLDAEISPRPELPRLDVPKLYGHLRRGATMVLNNAEEADLELRQVTEALSAVSGVSTGANIYACFGTEEGFGVHYDDHDVFVLHLSGQKTWQLFGMTTAHPIDPVYFNTTPAPPAMPLRRLVLRAGDVLYLPRGYWHNAFGAGEPSLHVTFSVGTQTTSSLLRWFIDRLRGTELFREDVPRFATHEQQTAWARNVREELFKKWNDETIVADFLANIASATRPRPSVDLQKLASSANVVS